MNNFKWTVGAHALKLINHPGASISYNQPLPRDVQKLLTAHKLATNINFYSPKSDASEDRLSNFLDGLEPLGFKRVKDKSANEYTYIYKRGTTEVLFTYRGVETGRTELLDITDRKYIKLFNEFYRIIEKYQELAKKSKNIKEVMWKCQQELIDSGLEGNAKW
jgi:hypothetical protein